MGRTIAWTISMENSLKQMVASGCTLKHMAKKLKVSTHAVNCKLTKLNIKTKMQASRDKMRKPGNWVLQENSKDAESDKLPTIREVCEYYRQKYKVGDKIRLGGKRCRVVEICPYFMIVAARYRLSVQYTDLFIEDEKRRKRLAV